MQNKAVLRIVDSVLLLLLIVVASSCYHKGRTTHDAMIQYSERQLDSLSFQSTHHYTNNYNFVVKSDSIVLIQQQPEESMSDLLTDSVVVYKHDHLVVADIRVLPNDSVNSVWVQLARDQNTFGWIHESKLMPGVVPDDPISQFISTFSDVHLLIFLVVISVIAVVYWLRRMLRQRARIVHLRDINSFYPTLLTLIVATAATLYASIQLFAPDTWRHFYFHPTLNPFSVPTILGIFLALVWAMLIVGLAALDDTRHQLKFGDALTYLSGLAAVCAANYIIFSITTLYYIGYPLLVLYFYFAIKCYLRTGYVRYTCGNCGAPMQEKGRCPVCGTKND